MLKILGYCYSFFRLSDLLNFRRLKQTYVQDIEEESVGIRKAAPVQRGTGSKRSRAADVHNLSERVSKSTPKTDNDTDVGDYGIFIVLIVFGDVNWYLILVVLQTEAKG